MNHLSWRLATAVSAVAGSVLRRASVRSRAAEAQGLERRTLLAGTVYTVNSLTDDVASDGVVTLREAIQAASQNQAVTSDVLAGSDSDIDRIEFDLAALQAQAGAGNPLKIVLGGTELSISGKLQIAGPQAANLVLDANQASRVMSLQPGGDLSLSNLTLTGGKAAGTTNGGAILASDSSLALTNVVVTGNSADSGGGLYVASGTLSLTDVKVIGNSGTGVHLQNSTSTLRGVTISENRGGGLHQAYGTLALSCSIISGNSSDFGAGLYLDTGTSTLTNVIVAGNTANSYGGGIYLFSNPVVTLDNVTIARNVAMREGGGVYLNSGTATVNNTICAQNASAAGPDIGQSTGTNYVTLSGANNLIGEGTGQTQLADGVNGNRVGTAQNPIDPMLAEGGTFGMGLSPLPGSPVIDAGDDSLIPAGITMDVYGAARILGARVNTGAVETVLPSTAGVAYVVTSLADSIGADGVVTLREALAAANSNQAVGDAPAGSYSAGDRITFASGLCGTILTHGAPYQIMGSLDLVGPGAGLLALDAAGLGGVVDVRGPYDVRISGMTLTGGALQSTSADLAATDLVVSGSTGNGISQQLGSLTLTAATLIGNAGVGLYLLSCDATVTDVAAASNARGGVDQSGGTALLTHVTIRGNQASYGGGMHLYAGTATLVHAAIYGNTSPYGGAIYASAATLDVANTTIRGNTGSGVYLDDTTSALTNVVITGNSGASGAGVYIANHALATLTNATIARNAGTGIGIGYAGSVTLNNSIVAENAGASLAVEAYSSLQGMHNLIGDGTGQTALVNGANGNIVGTAASPIKPMLAEGDGTEMSLFPLPSSPAIDAGDDSLIPSGITTDIYGAARIQGARVNIGAIETVVPVVMGVAYVVTSLGDSVAADGVVTLREALAASNTNQAVGDAPAGSYSAMDRIMFAFGLSGTILTHGQAYQVMGSLELNGPGASLMALDAHNSGRVMEVSAIGADVTISGLTLTGGVNSSGDGGGLYNLGAHLRLGRLVIAGNVASGSGGGLYQYYGSSTLTNTTISGNSASSGGGVYVRAGSTAITTALITGNTAWEMGGGMYLGTGTSGSCTNAIVSGNTAGGSSAGPGGTGAGGGVYKAGGTLVLRNVTISRNTAPYVGGLCGSATLNNTIIAQNLAGDIHSPWFIGSNNLIGNGAGGYGLADGVDGNMVGTAANPIDPMLAESLVFGVGLSPLPGSPVIDSGNASFVPPGVATDVYGAPRIQGAGVNIGAVEMVLPAPAGTDYVVTSLKDTVAADGMLTLREALAAANSNQAVGDAPAGSYSAVDRITFAPGLRGTILTHGQVYEIQGSLELIGPGAGMLTLDGGQRTGLLQVSGPGAHVAISGMTLTSGGREALRNTGADLTLSDLVIRGNRGGGIVQVCGNLAATNVVISGNTSGYGGGVYIEQVTMALTNVAISGNTSGDGGGIYVSDSVITLTNVTVSQNTAGVGGGICMEWSTGTLNNTIVAGNVGYRPDFGSSNSSAVTLAGANNLIGVGSGQRGLANGVNGNIVGTMAHPIAPMLAEGGTFGIGLAPLPGSPAVDAGDDGLVPVGVTVDVYGAARIQGARVNIGAVETILPAVAGVTYVVTSLKDSTAVDGVVSLREALAAANSNQAVGDAPAGSYSAGDRITFALGLHGTVLTHGVPYQVMGTLDLIGPGAGLLTLDAGGSDSVVRVSGPYNVSISGMALTGGYGTGGGVYTAGALLTLTNMAISGNQASQGGGVFAEMGTLVMTNVLISGNTALSGGGGLYDNSAGSILTNVTIAGNSALVGGGIYTNSGTVLRNTIVARNAAETGPDLYDPFQGIAGANCLIGIAAGQRNLRNGVDGNKVGTAANPLDPRFVDISGTDSRTWDLRLQGTSPALNAGSNALIPATITTDLLGRPRIAGGTVDMGAYEYVAPLLITGTDGDDTITITADAGRYTVTSNGQVSYAWIDEVSSISISGLDGDDTIGIGPGVMACTLDGGPGDDSIAGGEGSDSIRGDDGNDTILGGAGDDTVMGNLGDDLLVGGAGADCVMGGLGADTLDGGMANDTLLGGDGHDCILGGDGDDWIEGRGKMDTIYGGAGNDTIYGGAGSDLIYGGDGDDLIDVGVNSFFHDTVYGGSGTDLVHHDSDDFIHECEGDLLVYGSPTACAARWPAGRRPGAESSPAHGHHG